jgi:hypothetical protein
MQPTIILSSLVVVLAAYWFLSWHEGNFVNILMPVMLFNVPAWYVLEFLYGSVFGFEWSEYAYFYCYLTYAFGVLALVAGFVLTPAKYVSIFLKIPRFKIPGAPYWILGFATILYGEVVVQFPELIFNPRQIYEKTRSGFGLQFFLSAFGVYFAFILLLFMPKLRKLSAGIFILIAFIVIYLHGSKGEILNLMLIGLYYAVFVLGKRFDVKRILFLGIFSVFFIGSLFYFTSYGDSRPSLLLDMAGYAEYTRNSAMIIDDPTLSPQMGRLQVESRFYVMVPRVLFPGKPKDYGAFWLAKRYYPERFDLDVGAPDFGLGTLYADFGVFCIIYYSLAALLSGIILKVLATRLKVHPDPGTFILFLVFMDVGLVPTGGGGLPIIFFYGLAHLANSLHPRKKPARKPPVPVDQSGISKLGVA